MLRMKRQMEGGSEEKTFRGIFIYGDHKTMETCDGYVKCDYDKRFLCASNLPQRKDNQTFFLFLASDDSPRR